MTTSVIVNDRHRRMTYCLSCQLLRIHCCRGLCSSCRTWHRRHGTLAEFGYPKPTRLEDFTWLRITRGLSVAQAAARINVSERTGWRYERQLRAAQQSRTSEGNP
jgi:hypothetical protein